jgi:hypothetical protein
MSSKFKIIILLIIFLGSCEDGHKTDCSQCMPDTMGDVFLKIYISDNGNPTANFLVTVYEGPIENGLIIDKLQINDYYYEYPAMLYKDYTLTVQYTINGEKYIAVDAVRPKVRYDETSCTEPCYYIYDNVVNLRLKYSK